MLSGACEKMKQGEKRNKRSKNINEAKSFDFIEMF
jgi:hypothetical protein